MAKYYKCDKCGKELGEERYFIEISTDSINLRQYCMTGELKESIDLCKDCYQEFREFMEEMKH